MPNIEGCTDESSINYFQYATQNDGSCDEGTCSDYYGYGRNNRRNYFRKEIEFFSK